ncbi:leucine-rich repeat-containing protein kinase family protein [Deefgea salmonis]|uniref:Leucine-rich repeat-containing serine/threonine-protein kinase n=1 Tax=Deefgea salmonis TaxID=2875502 RepID=A0ABS8BGS1_9NEIS|nr:leucine-rich repeat-containing protein kinase family protein [Deefgea salmonis]MCB5194912.1 leucine-rich repeat-containing serine/threonine-protein kinase [Deefgea salmonis]
MFAGLNTLAQLKAGALQGCTRLDLSCGLTEFPREIFALADSLKILNLSGNQLSSLPDDLPRLRHLAVIFCSENCFTELPAVLGQCPSLTMIGFKSNQIAHVAAEAFPPHLRWLTLTDNQITELPSSIGRCQQLEKLMLAGNRLSALPAALAQCQQLALIRLAANQLTAFPECLLQLPRLAWLAIGGNPFNAAFELNEIADVVSVNAADVTLGRQLGAGASGTIYQAQWHLAEPRAVAVKIFKGAVTSDGWPHTEMAVCRAAGEHPHLIGALAQLNGHAAGLSLIMPLISAELSVLAAPPSLSTCIADVYASDLRLTWRAALLLAHGIADAARHLHQRGILHGDLYAHNILYHPDGRTYLGDFGAASFYPPDAAWAAALEQIEIRAFGHLLAELLARIDWPDDHDDVRLDLLHWQKRCVDSASATQTTFADLQQGVWRILQNN